MFDVLFLDCDGVSQAVQRTTAMQEWLHAAWAEDIPVLASSATLVEAVHPRINRAALSWFLSRITITDITPKTAKTATDLLQDAGLHGHKYAIDALLAASVLEQPGNIVVLTSDLDDLTQLLGKHLRVTIQGI
jgi:hypothetical protein